MRFCRRLRATLGIVESMENYLCGFHSIDVERLFLLFICLSAIRSRQDEAIRPRVTRRPVRFAHQMSWPDLQT